MIYWLLKSVKNVLDNADLKIINIHLNKVNDGSFASTMAKKKVEN